MIALPLENDRRVLEWPEGERAVNPIVTIKIGFLVRVLALGHSHQAERESVLEREAIAVFHLRPSWSGIDDAGGAAKAEKNCVGTAGNGGRRLEFPQTCRYRSL